MMSLSPSLSDPMSLQSMPVVNKPLTPHFYMPVWQSNRCKGHEMAGNVTVAKGLTLEELRDIVGPIAERYGILRMFLFGSRARGDFDEDSDYDFIVLCPEGMGLIGLTNFRNELMEALNSPVDFAYEDYLNEGFKSLVGSDKVLVYGSE